MKHLFYCLIIFPILWETISLKNPYKTHKFILRFKTLKCKKFSEYSSTQKSFSILNFGYLFWVFIGFFSFQWTAFLVLFLLSFIPKKCIWVRWIDSLISLLILFFILLNAYHFKINILEFLNI